MLTDSEKRAVYLAVSRSATDRVTAQKAFQEVLATFEVGDGTVQDLLQALLQQHLITVHQAHELSSRIQHSKKAVEVASTQVYPPPKRSPSPDEEDPVHTRMGDYRLLEKLGQGGTCSVYLGHLEHQNSKVAVKILPEKIAASQSNLDRFYREAKSGALLNHPNIVRNITFGRDNVTERHYLVMEYVDGPSALELLERFHHLNVGDAVHIVLDIARGLEHAHSRNIIHRDVKPGNILLTKTGVAKLADMGLAKRTDENSHLTAARQGFGTPFYMPYEQAMNARHVDGRGDIYALGATLYHLVTGEVPFPGDNQMEIVEKKSEGYFTPASVINPEVPAELDIVLEQAMAREPKDRYQTISDMIVELERANLAAGVLSFVDRDLAIRDPLVRDRLSAIGQATRPDMRLRSEPQNNSSKTDPNIWYLRYQISVDQWCKTRATTAQVLRRLKDQRIPANVQVSHKLDGEYLPLRRFSVFRAHLRKLKNKRKKSTYRQEEVTEHLETQPAPARKWLSRVISEIAARWVLYLGGGLVLAILTTVGIVLLNYFSQS